MGTIRPKNWSEFQHYRDRKPVWIKLHRSLLDDYDFSRLQVASKAVAPLLWLLASEYEGGEIPADMALIAFRLRMPEEIVAESLKELIYKGFFVTDSNVLADRYQDASLETEKEREKETEREPVATAPSGADAPVTQDERREGTTTGQPLLDTDKPEKPKSRKKQETTLTDWIASLNGEPAIKPDDPILDYMDTNGIPPDYQHLSWEVFKRRFAGKKQKDWPAHYRNAIRNDWLKLWRIDLDGKFWPTTAGAQEMRVYRESGK